MYFICTKILHVGTYYNYIIIYHDLNYLNSIKIVFHINIRFYINVKFFFLYNIYLHVLMNNNLIKFN